MIRNVDDTSERSVSQDEIMHPAIERLCSAMEQRFRQIVVETGRSSDSEWMTVEEVAKELKVSDSIVYRWIEHGSLQAVDLRESNGRRGQRGFYRIRRSMLDESLSAKKIKRVLKEAKRPGQPRFLPKVNNRLGL